MKRFINRILLFTAVILLPLTAVIFLGKAVALKNFPFQQKKITTLILGDSHTQCALNDDILENTLNLSESADTYFYSYIKLKRMLEYNQQIETLILGYAPHNITANQDRWLQSSSINSFKLPIYFFLFDNRDLLDYVAINPTYIPQFSGTVIKRNFSHLMRIYNNENINKFGIGGYLPLEESRTKGEMKIANTNIKEIPRMSQVDVKYLKKIHELCYENSIRLILLSTPVLGSTNETSHLKYWQQNMPNAQFLDYSTLKMHTDDFADNSHLNRTGADKFTKLLKTRESIYSSKK